MHIARTKKKNSACTIGHRIKVIEYFGLCGAGKTTIHNLIVQNLEESKIISFEPKRVSSILHYLNALVILMKMMAYHPMKTILFLRHFSNRWVFLKLGLRVASLKTRKFTGISILKDSGVLQPIVSFEIEENKTNDAAPVKELLDFVPLPDVAFFVRVDPDIAMSRYLERKCKMGYNSSKSVSLKSFMKGEKAIDIMREKLEECGVNIIEIVNNKSSGIKSSFIDGIINEVTGYECQNSKL
jgi:thymidylate kinase